MTGVTTIQIVVKTARRDHHPDHSNTIFKRRSCNCIPQRRQSPGLPSHKKHIDNKAEHIHHEYYRTYPEQCQVAFELSFTPLGVSYSIPSENPAQTVKKRFKSISKLLSAYSPSFCSVIWTIKKSPYLNLHIIGAR